MTEGGTMTFFQILVMFLVFCSGVDSEISVSKYKKQTVKHVEYTEIKSM